MDTGSAVVFMVPDQTVAVIFTDVVVNVIVACTVHQQQETAFVVVRVIVADGGIVAGDVNIKRLTVLHAVGIADFVVLHDCTVGIVRPDRSIRSDAHFITAVLDIVVLDERTDGGIDQNGVTGGAIDLVAADDEVGTAQPWTDGGVVEVVGGGKIIVIIDAASLCPGAPDRNTGAPSRKLPSRVPWLPQPSMQGF